MSACCVSGCGNQEVDHGKLKFFTIPYGYRTFQANRRLLWLRAIQNVNGSVEDLARNARVCGAHFISGQASMDLNNPDFVPSVFTYNKQSPGYKKKGKWFYGRSKKRRRIAREEAEDQTTPPRADSPDDFQMPLSPSMIEEEETKTNDDETENKTVTPEKTSSPNKAPPSLRLPAGLPDINKMIPTLLLKSVFKPAGGYQCELCDESFTAASQLVKHKQLHEETWSFTCELCGKLFTTHTDFTEHQCSHEYSFPCNMCDRSFDTRQNLKRHKRLHEEFICELCGKLFTTHTDFTEHQRSHEYSFACNMCDRSFNTSQNLKRHKLLHVRDGRKCQKCGVLFCQRHNHILYVPQTESEQDSYIVEESCKDLDGDRTTENTRWVKPEPDQTADLDAGAQSTMPITHLPTTTVQTPSSAPRTPEPLPKTHNALPPASHTRILTEIPVPVFKKPFSVPRPAPAAPRCSRNKYPANFVQPHLPHLPELTSSLKMFSPQFLTSAFLDVKRNYEYILSKPRAVKIENIVKEEPCALPLIPPRQGTVVKHIKEENAVYDLEIML